MTTDFWTEREALTPTLEITRQISGRVTGWGWTCSCGDEEKPEIRPKETVLAEARTHFDTKHMGAH